MRLNLVGMFNPPNAGTYNDFKEEEKNEHIRVFIILFDDNHFFCGT